MSGIDKLMDDLYEEFEENDRSDVSDIEETAEVIENQVGLDDVLEDISAAMHSQVPAGERETSTEEESPLPEKATTPTEAEVFVSVTKDGQYSLFGEDDYIPEQGQESGNEDSCGGASTPTVTTGKKGSGKKESKPKTAPPKPKEEIKVTAEWTLHYSAQAFTIGGAGGLFPTMTDTEEKTLEEVRQKMEEEFFEFTQSRVKWDYDKDMKRLYPDVYGTSKGAKK